MRVLENKNIQHQETQILERSTASETGKTTLTHNLKTRKPQI